ncbi:MAG: cation-translocating P-type ATPase [Bacillota bacterium]|jgi:Cd2+/Zn2+-exporting ATPase|nr:cation-translocating P-type ATPase [Bacillota bacterium]
MLIRINKFLNKQRTPILVLSVLFLALGFLWERNFLLAATAVAGFPILVKAVMALLQKSFSIELLVVIAITGALYLNEYNESSLVSFFFLFGDYLEARTLQKTRNSIQGLLDLVPAEALVMKDGVPVLVPVEEIEQGRIVLVKTGGKVPVDGTVVEGTGSIDQSSMTGESIPVYKQTGDAVFAGTVLEQGTLQIEATGVGEDTSFARMIELVEEAQETKTTAEKFLNRFAKWYTPAIIVLSFVVYFLTKNLHIAITFLVIACPGALVIGAPVSTVVGIGNAARQGVLYKGGEALEKMAKVDVALFDKTGTLTTGKPEVTLFEVFDPEKEQAVSEAVYFTEQVSEHPLGAAIMQFLAKRVNIKEHALKGEVVPGQGVKAVYKDTPVAVGNDALMETEGVPVPAPLAERLSALRNTGKTMMLIAINGKAEGIIGIEDPLKDGAKDAVQKLRDAGIQEIYMLSGDHDHTVQAVAKQLHLDGAMGSMKPDGKAEIVKKHKKAGKTVLMAGDGVNDAPALALADVGLAMGMGGADVSIETADVVLMAHEIQQVAIAKTIARRTVANIRENTAIAMGTVLLLLAGVLMERVGLSIGMFVHEASILAVILNAMRLIRK